MEKTEGDIFGKAVREYKRRNGIIPSPRAVLFDMDGVLFDSMKNHTASWYKTMRGLGIPCERDEFYLYEGCTGKGTINMFFHRLYNRDATDDEVREIYETKSAFFNALPEALPMPGAKGVLDFAKKRGMKIILVTGSGQKSLIDKLNTAYPGIFSEDRMVTAYDVKNGKPHPEPYLKGLEKAGVEACEALVVENAPMGVRSGRAADIFTIAVNTGPLPRKVLLENGADIVFDSMIELETYAESLLNSFECLRKN